MSHGKDVKARSSGPVFRLASISKNLSIAPPVRVAPSQRKSPHPRGAPRTHTHSHTQSQSQSHTPPPGRGYSPTRTLSSASLPSRAAKTSSSSSPSVTQKKSTSSTSTLKRKINPVVVPVPNSSKHPPLSPPPAPTHPSVATNLSAGITTRRGGDVTTRTTSPRASSDRSTSPRTTLSDRSSSPRSKGSASPRSTRSNSKSAVAGSREDTKRHVSEMKPKSASRNVSRSKNKNDGFTPIDPEDFWDMQTAEQWPTVTEEHLKFLRKLQEEQYDGYQYFLASGKEFGGLQCFQPSFPLPVPAPLEATRTVALPNSFAYQLACRGSADDVFWRNVMGNHSKECGVPDDGSCLLKDKLTAREEPEVITLSRSNSLDVEPPLKCDVQSYIDFHCAKCNSISDDVRRNRASLDSNIFMFPKPLPSLGHLTVPPSERTSGVVDVASKKCTEPPAPCDGKGVTGNGALFNNLPQFDPSIFRTRTLGKRGRLYDELWDEEDYLEKKSALIERCNGSSNLIPFRTSIIKSWSEILNNYRDDHDGVYVDSLLETSLEKIKQKKIDEVYNIKREGDRIKLCTKQEEGILYAYSPTVPVSCHHPAAWGRFRRRRGSVPTTKRFIDPSMGLGLDVEKRKRKRGSASSVGSSEADEEVINPTHWHPASYSTDVVLPMSFSSSPRQKSKSDRLGIATRGDDIDDLSIHLDAMLNELAVVSAKNFILLSDLAKSAGIEMNLQSLRCQQRALEDTHLQLADFFKKTTDDIQNAAVKASLQQQIDIKGLTDSVDDVAEESSFSTISSDPTERYSTVNIQIDKDNVEGESSAVTKSNVFQHKGIIPDRNLRMGHIDHSLVLNCERQESFFSTLRVGDLVEVCGTSGIWSIGSVVGFEDNSSGLSKMIQIKAIGSCGSDVQWVSQMDGVIAKPGENVPPFVVEVVRRSLSLAS